MTDFTEIDTTESLHEWIKENADYLTSYHLTGQEDDLTLVEVFADFEKIGSHTLITNEDELSATFDQLLEETDASDILDDEPAFSEAFGCYTDSLTRTGRLHPIQYHQYGYVGKHTRHHSSKE